MSDWSRRAVLKAGVSGPFLTSLAARAPARNADPASDETTEGPATTPSGGAGRERLLLDFGWRFCFGHANDPAQDLGFGSGQSGNFQKTGTFLTASRPAFDDSHWRPVSLPHDWAVDLPFQNDPALSSKGFYPLGRTYPETSVGWYRLAFELPASDAGRRISVEFDGAYRETTVALNGFYIGRHSGGYDPFSFDLTDFVTPGAPNVLLLRVDATLSDGWFYEGAGIYRHAWLVKTNPLHVKKWGTLVRAQVQPRAASLSIRTEVENHGTGARELRVISTVLDPAGSQVGRTVSAPVNVEEWGESTCEQQLTVKQPALWSLEERNQYRLVTELSSNGTVTDRYETRFGIRDLRFDAEQGFFLNGRPVKVKGTCNHQDHAGLGAALPDAAQHYRIRRLQEMGCNALRTSHNPPTPELLDACDKLGMLVLAETRMLSSNPEGRAQLENLVRRDRNHPSVFMWSLGNEETVSATETGLLLLANLKRIALQHDGSRPVTVPPLPMSRIGSGGLAVSDVMGYNYTDPEAEAFHEANPGVPVIGTENVSAVGSGITGLWRPAPSGADDLASFFLGAEVLFTFRQEGTRLSGAVERLPGFVSLNPPATIEDGKVDDGRITFRAGATAYTGVLRSDQIEIERGMPSFGPRGGGRPAAGEPRPAIGPPPDGSDPSLSFLGRGRPAPIVLHRVSR